MNTIKLTLVDGHNQKHTLFFDPSKSSLVDCDGNYVEPAPRTKCLKEENEFFLVLKIGEACNMSCSYCTQRNNKNTCTPVPADVFARQVFKYIGGRPLHKFCITGGEPLLYFDTIKKMYNVFQELYQGSFSGFRIVTNGVLLKKEIVDWLLTTNNVVLLSYDGPQGSNDRNRDVLSDPEVFVNVQRLLDYADIEKEFYPIVFSNTITAHSLTTLEYRRYMEQRLGRRDFMIFASRPVRVTDSVMFEYARPIEDMKRISREVYYGLITGELSNFFMAHCSAHIFNMNINQKQIALSACRHKDPMSVYMNMAGDILGCYNYGRANNFDEPFKLGNIFTDEYQPDRPLMKAKAASLRWEHLCSKCPTSFACMGNCPQVPWEYEEYTCYAYYYAQLPWLGLALHKATGLILVHVDFSIEEAFAQYRKTLKELGIKVPSGYVK